MVYGALFLHCSKRLIWNKVSGFLELKEISDSSNLEGSCNSDFAEVMPPVTNPIFKG